MSIIERIKNIFKSTPPEPDMVHPVFGKLSAEVCGDDDDFWQCESIFAPLGYEISITIYAGSAGPSQAQVEFYNNFVKEYEKEFKFVAPALASEYATWTKKNIDPKFINTFKFVGISIPKNGNRNEFWELSFDCLDEKNGHMFTVEIEGGVIKNVRADG